MIINDPSFHQRADHRGYSLSLSQILTRNAIVNFNYELLTDQGYLANPYREIRYLSAGGLGFTLAPQVYPNTRTSNAASLQWKYYLPWRASLTAQYRFFRDTWGIVANTTELDYTWPVWRHWTFDGSLRYYEQTHASFYSDLFPRADYQNFMARDRELAAFKSYTVRRRRFLPVPDAGDTLAEQEHHQRACRSPADRLQRLPRRAARRRVRRGQRTALQAQREHLPGIRFHLVLARTARAVQSAAPGVRLS